MSALTEDNYEDFHVCMRDDGEMSIHLSPKHFVALSTIINKQSPPIDFGDNHDVNFGRALISEMREWIESEEF